MVRATVVTVALVVLAAASAEAVGEQSRKWWQSGEVRKEIGLTADQSARIEAIFQKTLPELRAQKRRLDELEDALSAMLRAEQVSEEEVSLQIDRVETARSALSKSRTLMLFRMYRVLSADQRTALRKLHERNRDRDRRHDHERKDP